MSIVFGYACRHYAIVATDTRRTRTTAAGRTFFEVCKLHLTPWGWMVSVGKTRVCAAVGRAMSRLEARAAGAPGPTLAAAARRAGLFEDRSDGGAQFYIAGLDGSAPRVRCFTARGEGDGEFRAGSPGLLFQVTEDAGDRLDEEVRRAFCSGVPILDAWLARAVRLSSRAASITPEVSDTLDAGVATTDAAGRASFRRIRAGGGAPALHSAGEISAHDSIPESPGRRWAAESGATVGARVGTNLRSSTGVALADADVITAEGTAADTTRVGGTAAATVRDRAEALDLNLLPPQAGREFTLLLSDNFVAGPIPLDVLGLEVGDRISWGALLWDPDGSAQGQHLRVQFRDATNTPILDVDSTPLISASTPTLTKKEGFQIPANTASLQAFHTFGNGSSNMHGKQWMLCKGSVLRPWQPPASRKYRDGMLGIPTVRGGNRGSRQRDGSPLTAQDFDPGAAQINIGAHTVDHGGVAVEYESGTISASNSSEFLVYLDDADLAGLSTAYAALIVGTPAENEITQADGRYYVGRIATPDPGGIDTAGETGAGGQF